MVGTGKPGDGQEFTNHFGSCNKTPRFRIWLSGGRAIAGTIGNEEDLTTTREEWYSPELKLVVQSTQNDPRLGQTTFTLNDIQQGPPEETLFQVPADYKIEEIPVPKPAS
jgi:hypothetical protein